MTDECIFCKIGRGELDADVVHRTDDVVAFRDIDPKAPVHVLVIPRRHIASVNDLGADDADLVGALYMAAQRVAAEEGVADSGYRLVMNVGDDGGQAVHHIHLHLLGGRALAWPPG